MSMKPKATTRHNKYKIGTTKLTCTVENEDAVKCDREAENRGFKDRSEYLRFIIHEAVYDVALLPEDYDTLKQMRIKQESK